jgi:thiamine biosynthesis lipoprotein
VKRVMLLLIAVLGAARPVAAAAVTEVHYVMGTYFRITVEGEDEEHARAALQRCFTTTHDLDARFSRFDAHSELSQLNWSAEQGRPVTVSPEMTTLLQAALQLQAATDGTFDVAAGALTRLWRTTDEWPSLGTIAAARHTAGRGAFAFVGSTLVRRSGVSIDVDGIAKGWAVDRCVAQLRAEGIRRAFLNFGESSLYALGAPAGERGWTVWVRGLNADHALGALTLKDQAVSVSAVFGHERRIGSKRVGHIVDPRTGLPLLSPAMAVVVAKAATTAEAFSKALLIDDHGAAVRSPLISGALVVHGAAVRHVGRIAFAPFSAARPITAAAEPLR